VQILVIEDALDAVNVDKIVECKKITINAFIDF
jgi:hypothetical protein